MSERKESWRIEDAVVDPELLLLDVEVEEEVVVVVEVDRATSGDDASCRTIVVNWF